MLNESDTSQSAPTEETPVSHSKEPQVDLAEEAGIAAANQPSPKEQKIRSLDDLDVDGGIRAQIESYVSKSINEAVSKHDERHQRKLTDDGYMNRSQIEQLLADKDVSYRTREEAKERFLSVLGSEGLHPGSDGYSEVQKTYVKSIEEGKLTPEILLSEAGIRTLVALSGVSGAQSASPKSGFTRSAPQPDGSVAFSDGTTQLNVQATKDSDLMNEVRRAMEKSLDS